MKPASPDNEAITVLNLICLAKKIVPKEWGDEFWIENSDNYCLKLLRIKAGYQCSLHYHPKKDETFIVLSGAVRVEFGALEKSSVLTFGERVHIPPHRVHRFSARAPSAVLEISTTHSDDDVVRLEESGPIPLSERN